MRAVFVLFSTLGVHHCIAQPVLNEPFEQQGAAGLHHELDSPPGYPGIWKDHGAAVSDGPHTQDEVKYLHDSHYDAHPGQSIRFPKQRAGRKKKEQSQIVMTGLEASLSRRKAVQEAWHATQLHLHMDPHTLAERIHTLQVDNISQDLVRLHSTGIVRDFRAGAYHKAYLSHRRRLVNNESSAKHFQQNKELVSSKKKMHYQKKANEKKWARVEELKRIGVDFTAPLKKLESDTRLVELPTATKTACTGTVAWCVGQERGQDARDEFKRLRSNHNQRALKYGEEGVRPVQTKKRQKMSIELP